MKDDKKALPVLITGATGAIGSQLAKMLAADGVPLLFACRNTTKAERLKEEILSRHSGAQIGILELDLSSLDAVKRFAVALEAYLDGGQVAALVNNAGVIARKFELTTDGWEMNFGVNYIGVWALTALVRPHIRKGGRIVNVVSCTTKISHIKPDFLQSAKNEHCGSYNRLKRYGEAKLALLIATKEMALRFDGLSVSGADPGIVDSAMITMDRWFDILADLFFRPFIKSPQKGALPIYRALTDSDPHEGSVFMYRGAKTRIPLNRSIIGNRFSKKLWEITAEELSDWI